MSKYEYKYQVGGSLKLHSPTYVERKADIQLYEALSRGEYCYTFNSRQMGKSSLLSRTYSRLNIEGNICVCIDFSAIGSKHITPKQWYKSVISILLLNLDLFEVSSLRNWWEQSEDYSLLQKLRFFFERLLKELPTQQIFIFIDEVDSILSLDFSSNDFFAFIRFCYNHRNINSEYQRLNFALFGVIDPTSLTINSNYSPPFNLGTFIELNGFNIQEAFPLSLGLNLLPYTPTLVLAEILAWTGGQPFLTQKVCALSIKYQDKYNSANYSHQEFIANIVQKYIIDNWQFQDRPEHLKTISDRILNNQISANRLLNIYQQLLNNELVKLDNSSEQNELLLSGLTIRDRDYLKIKNIIYQKVFDREWVIEQLAKIRPYKNKFDAWRASQERDRKQLLSGLELKKALTWAENKQLGDLDYRYLNASQKINQEIIEREKFALLIFQQANQLLAQARQNARKVIKKMRIKPIWIFLCAVAICISIIWFRNLGWLQRAEFAILDYYIQHFSPTNIEPNITIITIDESDLTAVNEFPLSDSTIVKALNILTKRSPQAIGLGLFRYSTAIDNNKLQELIKTKSNIFGVEKIVSKDKIIVSNFIPSSQIGFSDLVLDFDGKIRRALLSVRLNETEIYLSFSTKLALYYLANRGILPESADRRDSQIKLGKANLLPLRSNSAAYLNKDFGGYQILLHNQRLLDRFTHFSLNDLLANKIPSSSIRDRIILIGSISDTSANLYLTPLSKWKKQQDTIPRIAPVVVHANIIAQILSSALDGVPLLTVWSKIIELIWIFFWAIIGASIAWSINHFWLRILFLLGATSCLTISSYLAFDWGYWIPLIPAILTLLCSALAIVIIRHKQLKNAYRQQVIKYLIEYQTVNPTISQISLSFLKQKNSF